MSTVVHIGFNGANYTVRESDGNVLLQIDLKDGEFDEDTTISIQLNTVNGSADSKQSHKCIYIRSTCVLTIIIEFCSPASCQLWISKMSQCC